MIYSDTKLIVFLQTFSKKETEEFEKFIISPYFKQGRDLQPLYKAIIKFYPDFDPEKFNEEIIYKELYPDSDFGDRKSKDILKTLSSSLLKMAEEFMVISNLRKNKVLRNRTMLEELLDRDLVKYFIKYRDIADEVLNMKGELSGNRILEKYFIKGTDTRYFNSILDHGNYLKNAFKSGEYLSEYFLINLLRIAKLKYFSRAEDEIEHEKDIADLLFESMDIEKVLKISEDSPHNFLLAFHYYSYLSLIKKCDPVHFAKAKEIFYNNKSKISRMEKFYLYADLLNIQNLGYHFVKYTANRREIYDLLISCIEDGAYKLTKEAYMQPGFYRNVILNAIFFKDYEKAYEFTDKFSDELKPAYRKNMKFYSRALISFGKGDFEDALVNISKVKYDLVNFKVDVKLLSLKIFYELRMTEQAFSMTDTFRHYLKSNNEIPAELKESYSNFIKSYIRILNIREKKDKEEAMYMKKETEDEKLMAQRSWLIDKLEAL